MFLEFMADPQWSDWSTPGLIELQSSPSYWSLPYFLKNPELLLGEKKSS